MKTVTSKQFIKDKVGEPDFVSLQRTELEDWLNEYHSKQLERYDKARILETIISRIIGLPFIVLLTIISLFWLFFLYIKNYILFGGETIIYTQSAHRTQINDIFRQLNKIRLSQIVRDKINEKDIRTKESKD